ncbi:hypothetical protein SBDP1_260005 [Syntrophobacter sp. SbD1]|nr:hypothetical protein SBDP1_260005 [Syntrophobacter sp. SbD1]
MRRAEISLAVKVILTLRYFWGCHGLY